LWWTDVLLDEDLPAIAGGTAQQALDRAVDGGVASTKIAAVQESERFAALAGERYVSLTTFKRDGSAASTPVWVVSDDGRRLLVWTGADTWKVKRIRRDSRVRITPSDARGRPRGEPLDGTARLLGPDGTAIVEPLLRKKYGFIKRALDVFNGLMHAISRRSTRASEYIEILPRGTLTD
jgi:uncharacterized protein